MLSVMSGSLLQVISILWALVFLSVKWESWEVSHSMNVLEGGRRRADQGQEAALGGAKLRHGHVFP